VGLARAAGYDGGMKPNPSPLSLVLASALAVAGFAGIALTWLGRIFPSVGVGARIAIFLAFGAVFGAGIGLPFKRPFLGAFMGAVFWFLLAQIYKTIVLK
jgi:hypothetical protein